MRSIGVMLLAAGAALFGGSVRAEDASVDTAVAVVAAAPGAAFVRDEALAFSLKPFAAGPVAWTLSDWNGQVLRRGVWPGDGADGLVLEPLPNGYYQLALASDALRFTGARTFAVVPDPAKNPAPPDMFFALDNAQSWLARPDRANPRQPANAFELMAEMARRSGARMVRERMSWAETHPGPDRYAWTYYKTNADLLAERGVQISGMYHDSPLWTRNDKVRLPVDLLATHAFAKRVAADYAGQMTSWEFWNEPDHGFAQESAWDYAAAFKAAALGYKAGNPDAVVGYAGFAITPLLPYADAVMKNGAGDYAEIFTVHTYEPIRSYPMILDDVRAHLARHGQADRPIWFTENGSAMEGAGRLDSFIPGVKMHSPDQELLIAEYLQKMMITMQHLGVARDFFFVLPPYSESNGNKDWGLMRRDYTVKPGFAAFATLVDRLARATALGAVELADGVQGHLYRQPDGTRTLVYWSISELDTSPVRPNLSAADRLERPVALPPQPAPPNGVDMLGTPFTVADNKLTATRFPAFVDNVAGLEVSAPATPPPPLRPVESAADRAIVFRTVLSDDFVLFTNRAGVDVPNDKARFTLQIWNFSDEAKEGTLAFAGGEVTGAPDRITVPPMGKTEIALAFTPAYDELFQTELAITGHFNNRPATPLAIPVQGHKAMAVAGREMAMPSMLDPGHWRKNASGTMEIDYDEAEEAVRFRTRFPAIEDRWVYPEYVLQLPQETLLGALGIGFEAKVSDAAAVRQMLVMAVMGKQQEGGKSLYLRVNNPGADWREHFVQFPADFDPAQVEMLRIGLNSARNDVTFRLRNVRFFYRPLDQPAP